MTHRKISFIKSGLRIGGFGTIMLATGSNLIFLVFLALVAAEVLGVVEELVPTKVKA